MYLEDRRRDLHTTGLQDSGLDNRLLTHSHDHLVGDDDNIDFGGFC